MKIDRFIHIIFSLLLLNSCAIQVPPGGGEKDVIPPTLIKADPPNYSTGFIGHDFKLDFDEYITLNDLGNQLIVSPLLKNSPEVHVRKKSILVHISDTLLENTTYTINFGQGIAASGCGRPCPIRRRERKTRCTFHSRPRPMARPWPRPQATWRPSRPTGGLPGAPTSRRRAPPTPSNATPKVTVAWSASATRLADSRPSLAKHRRRSACG